MSNRDTRTAYQARAAATERIVDEAGAIVKAEQDARFAEAKARAAAANAPVAFTEEAYRAAKAVRTRHGWHLVVRVNAKSVTVSTGYSWTDRVDRVKILEVR